jgi:rhamnosyltransferase subunit B
MTRIVLATWGSLGDLLPYIELARCLRERGHRPVVVARLHQKEIVERAGVSFASIRPNVRLAAIEQRPRLTRLRGAGRQVLKTRVLTSFRESYHDLEAAACGAALLVSHPAVFAAPLVAARLGLPWASTVLTPGAFASAYDPPVFAQMPWVTSILRQSPQLARMFLSLVKGTSRQDFAPVDSLRVELGLEDLGHPRFEGQFSRQLTLGLFSAVLGERQSDWPPRTRVTGFMFAALPGAPSQELARFLGAGDRPIVFVRSGSSASPGGVFFRESIMAANILGRRAVLVTGPRSAVQLPPSLPPSVLAVESAPYETLFPGASLIAHHGGIGTTALAMKTGVPALVVPSAFDQFDNAARVVRIGAGRMIPSGRYTARRAAAALAALTTQGYRDRLHEIAGIVASERGVQVACDAIEAIL